MNYFKPVNLLDGRPGRSERLSVYDAVSDLYAATGLPGLPPVADYGHWRSPAYVDPHGYMVPYMSVDWYVEQAREPSRRRLDVQLLMAAFCDEPWRAEDALGDHIDVLIVDEPLFDPTEEEQFGLCVTAGYALPGIAVVLSTHHTDRLDRVPYSLLKTLAMRELAHGFGVPGFRGEALEVAPRLACTNPCILGPCLDLPADLERLTDIRLASPPFCDVCLEELRHNLAAPYTVD